MTCTFFHAEIQVSFSRSTMKSKNSKLEMQPNICFKDISCSYFLYNVNFNYHNSDRFILKNVMQYNLDNVLAAPTTISNFAAFAKITKKACRRFL